MRLNLGITRKNAMEKTKILIGVARAGNVIGGGDWSDNRLIPDCVKSWSKNKKVLLVGGPNLRGYYDHFVSNKNIDYLKKLR